MASPSPCSTAARPCRHSPGDHWFTDEMDVRVAGRWTYLYRVIDQFGQVIEVLASEKWDLAAARRFFARAPAHSRRPVAVTTDRAAAHPRVLDEQLPPLTTSTPVCEQQG